MSSFIIIDEQLKQYLTIFPAGYYVYIETSSQRTGYKARLISPQLSASSSQSYCVGFWYHMYGQHVAQLNVYVQYGLALPATPTWTRQGTQGNKWIQTQLTVNANKPFNVGT